MRHLKLTVRRLTQTETKDELNAGRLNESFVDALSPNQAIIYKSLILDYHLDEAVVAFACLQTNFRSN